MKDILLGALLCAVIVLCVAAAETHSTRRYQLSTGNGYAFVIDSETGQVWGANVATAPAFNGEPPLRGVQAGFWEKKAQ